MKLIKSWSNLFIEAGCDEVGRGSLSGPVVAAAVIIDNKFKQNLVNDSKKLTFKNRLALDSYIKNNVKEYAIAEKSPSFIDEHNILNASIYTMHWALDQLKIRPELLLIDGNRFHQYQLIPHECIIKGDEKVLAIACASILAKNYRDQLMINLHEEFSEYGWNKNMGYATKVHREALIKYGPTIYHRRSFRLDYSSKI
ncbi:ribonuclease HII [Kaistella jeonii]|uniref:Ribonuclease HII n=1 Tax=Kaistella jeonii TaxID=266749 RepID=A0A0C1EX44_9FLAO|nr:ribonuclease HII [Kaistella jeonii]KIA85442.1 ribonuclease HII [Kaistella jeonii]SFC42816.1 RNase HII [Kaistella jeonii]VEI96812.1 Ribonuclease HII [Kaistella jeonii]